MMSMQFKLRRRLRIATVDRRRFSGYQGGVHAMRKTFFKATSCSAWVSITFAVLGLLWVFAPGQASAGFCSATNCSFALTNSNFTGTGTFGTVTLNLSSNVVTIDVNLASAYRIVKANFPGAVGFADKLGGGPTMGNFKASGGVPSPFYSGHQSLASGCDSKECRWGSFGYANNAASVQASKHPLSFQQLSFTVDKGTSITDIHQLLQQFSNGQRGPAYLVGDGCIWEPEKLTCDSTGLFTVTQIPEPASLAILASGLLALGFLRWKRVI